MFTFLTGPSLKPIVATAPPNLRPGSEEWAAALLMWLGYSLLVGLLARAIVPLRRPLGTFPTVLVGMIGATLGPIAWDWIAKVELTSPLRPQTFLASVAVSACILLAYRMLEWMPGRHPASELERNQRLLMDLENPADPVLRQPETPNRL